MDKPLKPRQARLLAELLPRVATPDPSRAAIELSSIFPNAEEIWLEVGFGGGEHIAWHASRHPDIGFIGAEPFINGVAKLLVEIEDRKLQNVRIHNGDVRPLLESLPARCVSRIFVLHPDPWPKARHHKRRMISPWFFDEAARLLLPGGELRVASDIADYIRWTLMHARRTRHFNWVAATRADWRIRPDDWPQTRYEAKAIREGRQPTYLLFKRT